MTCNQCLAAVGSLLVKEVGAVMEKLGKVSLLEGNYHKRSYVFTILFQTHKATLKNFRLLEFLHYCT